MSWRSDILARFSGAPEIPAGPLVLLLDLTRWHRWHSERGTLPADLGSSLQEACRGLGTAIWAPFRPWRVEHEGIQFTVDQTADTRDLRFRTQGRTLTARWTRGPDGDWWQTEYPVKSLDDLAAAEEIAAARRYVLNAAGLEAWRSAVGDDGVTPLELPMRPFSDLLHTMLGWGEGLLLMQGEGKAIVGRILNDLELKLQSLTSQVAQLPGELLLAPDNLDGQYVSPRAFQESLAASYAATADRAQQAGKPLVVHVGGPARRLVALLAAAGVSGIEGIAGPPQGDVTLTEARGLAGPEITLWGGIPQDLLDAEHDEDDFESAAVACLEQAREDPRLLIGVADQAPVHAEVGRLRRLAQLAPRSEPGGPALTPWPPLPHGGRGGFPFYWFF